MPLEWFRTVLTIYRSRDTYVDAELDEEFISDVYFMFRESVSHAKSKLPEQNFIILIENYFNYSRMYIQIRVRLFVHYKDAEWSVGTRAGGGS